jgi:multiple RNA-binding domain-containing protein 1
MSRIIVKNIPKEITELELKNHFNKKGEITDIKIMRTEKGVSRRFAFLGFKTEEQTKETVKYFNNTYLKTCKIQVEEAKVQGDPRLNKNKQAKTSQETEVNDKTKKINQLLELAKKISNKSKFDEVGKKLHQEEIIPQVEESQAKDKESQNKNLEENKIFIDQEKKINPKRLYLKNLAFEVKEDDLRAVFEKYGELSEIHVPINRKTNQSFGYAYIAYQTVESAVLALSDYDKTIFQGRILHITPANEKEEKIPTFTEPPSTKSKATEFKKQKVAKQKASYDDETNWNYLFMNQNAVIEAVAKKLNIPKSDILSKDNTNLAVQVAAMETTVINDSKEWLQNQGINLDILKGKRQECLRSKNVILIKNISANTSKEKLEEYFSRYGVMVRFLLSPMNTLGIAEFVDKKHAENCMKKLAYFEIDGLPLYLEFAPEGIIRNKNLSNIKNSEEKINQIDLKKGQGKIIFITNLNFSTKESRLKKFFEEKGFPTENVKIVTHQKEDSDKILSAGYGFVELQNEDAVAKALRTLQGTLLDAHSIKLSLAKTEKQKSNEFLKNKRKAETELNDYEFQGEEVCNTKILVKNLAFEANKNELRNLFKAFGEVKTVRLPSKLDGSHRGFAFIDFVSAEEAQNAFKSLGNTHFYGRKLVLEWAQKEKTLEELREETGRKMRVANIKTHRTQNKAQMDFK